MPTAHTLFSKTMQLLVTPEDLGCCLELSVKPTRAAHPSRATCEVFLGDNAADWPRHGPQQIARCSIALRPSVVPGRFYGATFLKSPLLRTAWDRFYFRVLLDS